MKKYILIITVFVLAFASACKAEKKSDAEQTQMKNVMAIHDEVMPEMGKIGRLVTQLRAKIDADQGGIEEKKAMEDLQEASKSMMNWMQDFMDHFDQEEISKGKVLSKEKQALLDEDEQKMIAVKNKMEASIANAQKLLQVD